MTEAPRLPSAALIRELAAGHGIDIGPDEAESYRRMMGPVLASCRHIDAMTPDRPTVKYDRPPGRRPPRRENPWNAWYWRSEIKGAPDGPLADKTVGVKDNMCVAGIPMLIGTGETPFVPDVDATAVTRLLDAGATILGKTIASDGAGLDDFDSNSPFVTVRNPRRPTHAPGGSSSGSAAALVAGDIDLALGSDQGGSVRIPASWSGVVGLRPTYGLVPYTGLVGSEMTMVALGPLATSVETVALAMNALAGPDPLDPRQRGIESPDVDYTATLEQGVRGLRVGLVKEAFDQAPWEDLGLPGSEAVVDGAVRDTLRGLAAVGAVVEEVSLPAHTDAVYLFNAMYNEGNGAMILANAVGTNFIGDYNEGLMEAYGRAWRGNPNNLSPARRSVLIFAEYLRRHYHGHYYARAHNLRGPVRRAYDGLLDRYDVLAMPTVPFRATPIPPADLPPDERVSYAMQMIANTCQSAITGHPAISVPCAMADGLPIGIQFLGRHMGEPTLLRFAEAVESLGDWTAR